MADERKALRIRVSHASSEAGDHQDHDEFRLPDLKAGAGSAARSFLEVVAEKKYQATLRADTTDERKP